MASEVPALYVGSDDIRNINTADWSDDYNIKGYEYVFLDYYSLEHDLEEGLVDDSPSTPNRNDIFRSVFAGNDVYIFLPSVSQLSYSSYIYSPQSSVPGDFTLVEESGKYVDQESISESWGWYFPNPFNWDLRLHINDQEIGSGREDVILKGDAIVANPSGEPVAWSLYYEQIEATDLSTQPDTRHESDGRVYFLPILDNWTPAEVATSILEREGDIPTSSRSENEPDWTSSWSLPNEIAKREKQSEVKREIEEKKELLQDIESDLEEYDRYKTLLWSNEYSLEELVPEVFGEIGFDVEGEKPHNRDGLLYLNGICYVMEITGTVNDISDKKYRQLLDWVGDAESEGDIETEYRGLLVVNPRRKEDPESRDSNEYLPTHLRRRMDQKGFKILTTPTLYEILGRFRSGSLSKEGIEELLLTDELIIDME